MNEVTSIPWGMVFSNFVWILGAAIILASFSYHEFLANLQKTKRTEVFRRESFKKPLMLGLILIATGIATSVHKLWLSGIFGVVAILLIIWFIKIIRSREQDRRD